MTENKQENINTGLEVAVIGMAGAFPGAQHIDAFWENLKTGVESISFFPGEEQGSMESDLALPDNPNYVKAGAFLEKKAYFDSSFFGYTTLEAEVMDPQVRVFLQCCWHALEHAGYDPGTYPRLIGLYAGASMDFYWEALSLLSGKADILGSFGTTLLRKDFLCTRTAYMLNLKGPAIFVQTACSTSLVAIHLASQGLLSSECDMALAGGVTVSPRRQTGYLYQEGMIGSPDGHCRAFDAKAAGMIGGEGVGIVVLKRLKEAAAEGDTIHAVIKGTAINNDGNRKVGFTAPSTKGQAAVIRHALQMAGVESESIGYLETHGTATPLGDSIEIGALKKIFKTHKKNSLPIGSVKTNIGHLDAAAGVAGFIKTVLALKHRLIPPSLHYETPNPEIDIENSPFFVNTTPLAMERDRNPLRAGVSSFGIGGTNAHVILEEPPMTKESEPNTQVERENQIIILSAKSETALEKLTGNIVGHWKENPGINFADAAYTLQVGRAAFAYRGMTVAANAEQAAAALTSREERQEIRGRVETRPVVFMYPGLGSQYVRMGESIYREEPLFRREMDRCFEIIKPLLGYDIKEVLYPSDPSDLSDKSDKSDKSDRSDRSDRSNPSDQSDSSDRSNPIHRPEISSLVVFIVEYALSQLLIKWGITPRAMIGYSLGEYSAACTAGVLTPEEAITLLHIRGRLLKEIPAGGMLSVPLPAARVMPLLAEFNAGKTLAGSTGNGQDISLAIDNGPSCVISGPAASIDIFTEELKRKKIMALRLNANRALHSTMMEPAAGSFAERTRGLEMKSPRIPYISNVTGQWITAREARDPGYWATHLKETVRFSRGMEELLKEEGTIFLEVGPGQDLSVLLRHHTPIETTPALHLIPPQHYNEKKGGSYYFLRKIGELWSAGAAIDWKAFHAEERRHRIPLPLYPFAGEYYWLEGNPYKMGVRMAAQDSPGVKKADITRWYYIPTWKRSVRSDREGDPGGEESPKSCWLLFIDNQGLGETIRGQLEKEGRDVIILRAGPAYRKINRGEYIVNPGESRDYHILFKEILEAGKKPGKVLHLWSVTTEEDGTPQDPWQETTQDLGFYSLLFWAQASGNCGFSERMHIEVVSNHLHEVTGGERLNPGKATLLGAVKVIPREYPNITCRSIDVVWPATKETRQIENLAEGILTQFDIPTDHQVTAYRGNHRWVQIFEPVPIEDPGEKLPRLKEKGVYLITGGLGGIGSVLAAYLAETVKARLILVGRSEFPDPQEWDHWVKTHDNGDITALKIKKIRELERQGAEILVTRADVCDHERMKTVIARAEQQYGAINGVIHAAGLPDGGVIPLRKKETTKPVLAPKVKGTLVLEKILKGKPLDFFVMCSSLSAIYGPFGEIAYTAANSFQDAYAHYKTAAGTFALSINWDFWQEVGMGVEVLKQGKGKDLPAPPQVYGILSSEGTGVFRRLLAHAYPQVAVSTRDLSMITQQINEAAAHSPQEFKREEKKPAALRPRPGLVTDYVPPKTGFETTFAAVLQQYLGLEAVGANDNVFDFGISSLDVIQINQVLTREIKKEIPLATMFAYPTIRSLGEYLNREENREGRGQVSSGGEKPPADLKKVENLLHRSIHLARSNSNMARDHMKNRDNGPLVAEGKEENK